MKATCFYLATDTECTDIGEPIGGRWEAICVKELGSETYNLCVFRPDGTTLAKTSSSYGTAKGDCTLYIPP